MIKIAYCRTMQPFAEKITKNENHIDMILMGSAAQVLSALQNNSVDGVLIGRYAKNREITETTKRVIFHEGITLVFHQKQGIDVEQLKWMKIKTYLLKNKISDVLNLFGEVEFRNSIEDCLKDGLQIPLLIDWKDFRDDFELLIPLNHSGKVPIFRSPVLYFDDIDIKTIEHMRQYI